MSIHETSNRKEPKVASNQIVSNRVPVTRLRSGDVVTASEDDQYTVTDAKPSGRNTQLVLKGPDGQLCAVEYPRGWHLDVVKWAANS